MKTDNLIKSFGKWKSETISCCSNGVIYLIVGEGHFEGTVKFINDNRNVDEASANRFQLSTQSEYIKQQKSLIK